MAQSEKPALIIRWGKLRIEGRDARCVLLALGMLLVAGVAIIAISGAVPPAVGVAVTKTAKSLRAMRWMARG